MQIFKRASAALKAANGEPYLTVRENGETVYIVGITRMTEIRVSGVAKKQPAHRVETPISGSAEILAGHLDRLGNGNHAGAARINRYNVFDQWGLGQTFLRPEDQATYDAEYAAYKASKKDD